MYYLEQKVREYLGPFAQSPHYTHQEGVSWEVTREDGTCTESGYQAIEAEFSVSADEISKLTPEKIRQKLDAVAQDMARQVRQNAFQKINEAIEESGTAIDAKGRPLSKELLLQALDSVDWGFTKDGDPIPPTLLMHPNFWETVKDDMAAWDKDEACSAQFERMIQRKREQWRDRESRRKLVD